MLFMVAALLLSFPRVWLPRARNPGLVRAAALLLHVAGSRFVGFFLRAASDTAHNAEVSNHAGRGSRAEKTGILRAAATRENDKRGSFACKLICGTPY